MNSILVNDLRALGSEQGHPFSIIDGTLHLRGSLLAVTPASQAMGGYKEGVGGARCKCRHCMANFDKMQNNFQEEDFEIRTTDQHEKQIQLIENAPSKYLKEYYSKCFGVNWRSKLLDVPDFNVTKQLPQDLMHIFLEGILSYHMKYMLNNYIEESSCSLNVINRDIQKFPLGYSEQNNRPVLIKESDLLFTKSTNLGQTAAQMHLLGYILPFVLGNYVGMDTSHWTCYLSLIEIMQMSMACSISYTTILV